MIIQDLFESPQLCPECGGISFSDLILAEKKDACYYKVKASAKVWPSAYASGRLVQCRKKGAANYGKSKNEGVAEGKVSGYKMYPNHDGTWYVEDENENVVLRNASKGEAEHAVWAGNQKLKQGVAEGSLEEVDRRGFLKGMGAAAVGAAAGYVGGVRRVQNSTLAQVLGKLNGFVKPLEESRVKDKWAYEQIISTKNLIQKYKFDSDIYNDDLYSFGEDQGKRAYRMEFPNGIQTAQDREKYEAILFELRADLLLTSRRHPKYSNKESVQQGVAEDFTDDVDNIYAMHPQPEKSEKIAFLILDKDEIEFATDWRELSDPYQQEFGYDLPLWDADDFGSYPNLVVKRITFDQYVNLVGNYIESEELAGSAMSKMKRGVAEDSLNEFAPGSGGDGRWYTDDEIADIIGEDWFEFDLSGEAANISQHGEHAKILLVQEAQAYFEDRGYHGVVVQDVRDDEDYLSWYISGNFTRADEGVAEDAALAEEFDLIESTVERLAKHNDVDAELIWEDLESLSDDELYVFAVTMPLMEDWQKANKQDRTDGMSRKAVNAYRRENPGSKLKTAVTTKPSKLKRGSKASKRRKSYCSRSRGQMKMHSISCAKTPDKAICKARRRWNCE